MPSSTKSLSESSASEMDPAPAPLDQSPSMVNGKPPSTPPPALALDFLSQLLEIPKQTIQRNMTRKLVDLGVDSLKIATLQETLADPAPTLLQLYNITFQQMLKLLESNSARLPPGTGAEVIVVPEVPIGKKSDQQLQQLPELNVPFKFTEMQEAYFIGRYESDRFCPCQAYSEFDFDELDIPLLEQSLAFIVAKHPMLRGEIFSDQQLQRVSPRDFCTKIAIKNESDIKNLKDRRAEIIAVFKNEPQAFWRIEATRLANGTIRLHVLFDMLFLDAASSLIICRDLVDAYNNLLAGTTPLLVAPTHATTSFREYCDLIHSRQESPSSHRYWVEKLDSMPGPPQLPRSSTTPISNLGASFERASMVLNSTAWGSLKSRATQLEVTPTALLLTAFSEVVRFFSHEPDFTLTLTVSSRQVETKSFAQVVGDFTNVLLCSVKSAKIPINWAERIRSVHVDLVEGLEHRDMGGLKVMRLLREKLGDPKYTFPVVFTSLLGLEVVPHELGGCKPTLAYQQTQTPEVWLDHQIYEMGNNGGADDDDNKELCVNWDYDPKFYNSALVNQMNEAYGALLQHLAQDLKIWELEVPRVALEPEVLQLRIACNSTQKEFAHFGSEFLLHKMVEESMKKYPDKVAVIDQEVRWTYAEIESMTSIISGIVQNNCGGPGHRVAIVMEKGWEQVVAVLGILSAGGTYLPINPSDPDIRIASILKLAECSLVLTQSKVGVAVGRNWMSDGQIVFEISTEFFKSSKSSQKITSLPVPKLEIDPDSVVYIIFTSGTEGEPKGVEITHRGAVNTCLDINSRFSITQSDIGFALSSLSFDLSVWDIFGMLGAGGTVVICKPSGTRDPDYWWSQLSQHQITIWNTVPTSFEMLIETAPPGVKMPLKKVLLSGDAIKIEFARQVKETHDLRLICMGGATEASIWSNYHEVTLGDTPTNLELVPYGLPLSNQTIFVLDSQGDYRTAGVVGEIYIGGVGVAKGYFKDPIKTSQQFKDHAQFGKLYSTGDLGRYLPSGEIQIIGRRDTQVKVGGHRVELAEIEHCVEMVPWVKRAVATCRKNGLSNRLIGFVQIDETFGLDLDPAVVEQKLRDQTAQSLPDYMTVQTWIVVPTIPLSANGKVDRNKLRLLNIPDEASPILNVEKTIDNRSDDVQTILRIAREILGDSQQRHLTPTCSLIEFGMTSLAAIRFSKKLSQEMNLELPYTLAFNYPTVNHIADMVSSLGFRLGQTRKSAATNQNSTLQKNEPIAVVGMACRLPGSVTNPHEFWEMLISGRDCVTDVPSSRFDMSKIYDPVRGTVGRSYTKRGAFMDNVDFFDNEFFGIPLSEAKTMDPQQRLLLEVAYEAFVHAGYEKTRLVDSDTGVFVGQMNYDWMGISTTSQMYAGTGVSPSISANRISFVLGLRGPSLTVDTACSSSLVALALAVDELRAGKCAMALAAGVNVMLHQEPYLTTCAAEMLSIDGRCATFDQDANGIVRGEGLGAVVLKPLSRAKADGDNVLALVLGTAVNQDGRSATLTAPNGLAQESVLRSALAEAGVEGKNVDFVECHGTGTALGDPIELEALKIVLGQKRSKPLHLGSVKTNIGHLEGAAGITGFIKTVLVLQNRQVPPNLHFKTLNPNVDLAGFEAIFPTMPTPLKSCQNQKLIAGVSSFGFGGTNSHAILQSVQPDNWRACEIKPKLFNSKRIPWTIPKKFEPSQQQSTAADDLMETEFESFFETKWMPLLSKSPISSGAKFDAEELARTSRSLVISNAPLATNGTNWTSIPFNNGQTIDEVIRSEPWQSIVVISDRGVGDQESLEPIETALLVLKEVDKMATISSNNQPLPDIWFFTTIVAGKSSASGGLGALARTARIEMPDISIRPVQCSPVTSTIQIAKLCAKVKIHCCSNNAENEFLLRSGQEVQVLRLVPVPKIAGKSGIRTAIRPNASYVISGGLGALGQVVAQWLIENGATHVALLYKTARDNNDHKSPNSIVASHRCDVSNLQDVQELQAELDNNGWPPVAGIIHAAGILMDSTIRNLNPAFLKHAVAPKVDGAKNLRSVFRRSDFTILFSSAAVVLGSGGQANYAVANATMDAMAEEWSNNGEKVWSVQWGAWSDGGMAAKQGHGHGAGVIKRLERLGFRTISNEQGKQFLQQLLRLPPKFGAVCVLPIDQSRLQQSRNPLLSQLKQKEQDESPKPAAGKQITEQEIRTIVGRIAVEVLGSDISDNCPLMEAGLSSLDVVSLRHQLIQEYPEIKIPSSVVFNYPTVNQLTTYIQGELAAICAAAQQEDPSDSENSEWQKLNDKISGRRLFLVGGVLGTARGTFERFAHQFPGPVFGLIPSLSGENPAESIPALATQYIKSIKTIRPSGGKVIIGGLSFGAIIAMEMARQLELDAQNFLESLILLDPRHTPPFTAPAENPADFEILVENYTPEGPTIGNVILVKTQLPDFASLSPLLKEAARSFQSDDVVETNCRRWCPNLQILNCEGHHFNFLNSFQVQLVKDLVTMLPPTNDWTTIEEDPKLPKTPEPIAVIGMSCRFPGGVSSPEDFWKILQAGQDCVTTIPFSRFSMDDLYDPDTVQTPGKSYTNRAAFMDNVEWFDHEIFGISQAEATMMDPQQRLLLEVGYEAFLRAGYTKESLLGSNTGVFVGQANYDWMALQGTKTNSSSPYLGAGTSASITANRLSYVFGLQGPSMVTDTACSSSLVALDSAVAKLRSGKCSLAIAAGVNVILNPGFFVTAAATQALSKLGRCATFDASADGYCRGEGVGAVILKRLSQAKTDGDTILALIRGTAVNQDGRSAHLTAPNGLAQVDVISSALADAGFAGKDVDFVECHGTGTALGDPIEVEALKNVLGQGRVKPVVLGAVKTNFGHLEGAAGIAGLIKTVLVLQHKSAPPILHFENLNPKIDVEGFEVTFPIKSVDLGHLGSNQLVAGVSSFGFGGTNAHVVLQEWSSPAQNGQSESDPPRALAPFTRQFLPWRRLAHPLLYHQESTSSFLGKMCGELEHLWDDHRINGVPWVPAASHLTMAAGKSPAAKIVELTDVIIARPMEAKPDMKVQCILQSDQSLEILGQESENDNNDSYVRINNCTLTGNTSGSGLRNFDLKDALTCCTQPVDVELMYQNFSSLGVQFGPTFRTIREAWVGEDQDEAVARIGLLQATMKSWERGLTLIHPAILDGAFQLLGLCALKTSGICVPFHFDRVVFAVQNSLQPVELWAHVRLTEKSANSLTGDAILMTSEGVTVAVVEGLTSRRGGGDAVADSLYETEWIRAPSPGKNPGIFGDKDLANLRCLLLSTSPVDTSGTNWLNHVATLNSIPEILASESWPVIFLAAAAAVDDQLVIQLGLQLLKASSNQNATTENVPEIWFLATPSSGAALRALLRTAVIEIPNLNVKCLEFPQAAIPALEIAKICDKIKLSMSGSLENDYRILDNGDIKVPRLKRLAQSGTSERREILTINPNGTYIVTGGLGALGLIVAKWLVSEGATHVVLLSRTKRQVPPPEFLELQASSSASVIYMRCDVSKIHQVEDIQKALRKISWPEVKGVVHAAGVLSDSTISNLDPASAVETSFAPKVQGAKNLRSVFYPGADFLILFSSAAAVFGSAGQANYAAANATMDAMAEQWSNNGENVLSIQWGAWSEGGMAAGNEQTLRRAERLGFGAISNALGTQILDQLFRRSKFGVVCATPINWSKMAMNPSRQFLSNFQSRKTSPKSGAKIPRTLPKSEDEIKAIVHKIAVEVLGQEVSPDAPLMEAGLDSLGAVEFRNRLSTELNINLPSVFVYNHPSLAEMVEFFAAQSQSKIAPTTQIPRQISEPNEPIAIVGMSCRLPGGVSTPEEFWSMLISGQDCISEIPSSRIDMDGVFDPTPGKIGKSYTKRAALMDNVEYFDNEIFNISAAEATVMDPQQRLLLEVGYEAFFRAGYDKATLKGTATGVFVGQANYDWLGMSGNSGVKSPYFGAGNSASITSNRISFALGLKGPSLTVDTACSSSLVALDLALAKLRAGKCSLALVGGVNVMLSTLNFVGSCAANMLSVEGRCATFDAGADGYCRGEGVGAVVLKRLSQATADGDTILALVKGTAVNQDGRSATLTAPNGGAQVAVISSALAEAGFAGKDVDYVECHGTGTALGDPIEVEALKNVLSQGRIKPVILGAVKTNFGHLEGAAGIAGLIKTVLVLQHRAAPPILHFKTLNSKIDVDFDEFQVVIPTEMTTIGGPKDSQQFLVAGVSSFGFGGTNAHAILQEWRPTINYDDNNEAAAAVKMVPFNRNFLPWRQLAHPLLYHRQTDSSFLGRMSGEFANLWDDHKINGWAWTPAASHLTMAAGTVLGIQANSSVNNAKIVELSDIVMIRPMEAKAGMEVECTLNEQTVQIFGDQELNVTANNWTLNNNLPKLDLDLTGALSRCTTRINIDEMYTNFGNLGLQFGPKFRTVLEAWEGEDETVARIGFLQLTMKSWERKLTLVNPAILDGAFQLLGNLALKSCGLCVPFHVDKLTLAVQTEQVEELWAHVRLTSKAAESLTGDVVLMSAEGVTVAAVEGLTSRRSGSAVGTEIGLSEYLYETEWIPATLSPISDKNPEMANLANKPCLIISTTELAVETLGTNWTHISLEEQVVELPESTKEILAQRPWPTIFLAVSIGAAVEILKEILKVETAAQNAEIWLLATTTQNGGAGLRALLRTAAIEMPNLKISCLELVRPKNSISALKIANLVNKIKLEGGQETEFRIDGDEDEVILVPRLKRMEPSSSSNATMAADKPIAIPNATYVISGGLGALGIVAAKWLTAQGATNIVLLSRTTNRLEPPQLVLPNVNCLHLQCDVSKIEQVRNVQKTLQDNNWPQVKGIIHAAGVLSDSTIANLDPSTLDTPFAPKVKGAENLREIFNPSGDGGFLILFSSASAVFGSGGQANYAAANATMDALAEEWSNNGENVLSIQWGAWSEGGMASDELTIRRAARHGFGAISNVLGMQILEFLLKSSKFGVVCASPIDWSKISSFPSSNFLSNFKMLKKSKYQATNKQRSVDNNQPRNPAEIESIVRKIAADVLDGKNVADDAPLMEVGLDSLGSVEFRNRLSTELDINLTSVFVYNHPTLAEIIDFMISQVNPNPVTAATIPISTTIEKFGLNRNEPVAIVGMACRLPGGVSSPEEFWAMLCAGRDCVTEVPPSRFNMGDDGWYDPRPGMPGKSYTNRGAFIDDAEYFDHEFFNISHAEAKNMDPQQRLLLEVGYEAFVSAGYDKIKLKGSDTGVFVGQMNYDWMMTFGTSQSYAGTGLSPAISSNRVSFALGLRGPSITMDTACSSSLVALDSAVEKLRGKKCGLALVAGTNIMLSPQMFVGESAANMLSKVGRCATFDEAADGYARGEGVGGVVLKLLSQATADGDTVLAVIKGSAVNQDGRSVSLTAPSGSAQESVIRSALADAGIDGKDVDFVECHGTGTPLGDPIEVEALKNVLGKDRRKPVVLGALKTNIGHLEGAAGVAALIKSVLVLQNRQAPKNLHFNKLNPNMDLTNFDAIISTKMTALGGADEERLVAGVSSFGFGGTNAHVILEESPSSILKNSVKKTPAPNRGKVAWLFTGQGSHFSGMGKTLYEEEPIFKTTLDTCADHLAKTTLLDVPLLALMFDPKFEQILNETRYSQPAIFSLEYALVELWRSRGVVPSVVVGHSIGEFAAAVTCGVMNLKTALELIVARGQLMDQLCSPGAMVAVLASAEEIQPQLPPDVDVVIAALNGPKSIVISGNRQSLEDLLKNVKFSHKWLPVNHGFHSPLMIPMLQKFKTKLDLAEFKKPPRSDIKFISTVTGAALEIEKLATSAYWLEQIVKPVNFLAAIQTLNSIENGVQTFVEIGPKPILTQLTKRILGQSSRSSWLTTADWKEIHGHDEEPKPKPKLNLFNRKFLPWKIPQIQSTTQAQTTLISKSHPAEVSVSDSIYESEWIDIDNIPEIVDSPEDSVPKMLSNCLVISFQPIDLRETGWINGVINADCDSVQVYNLAADDNGGGTEEKKLEQFLERIVHFSAIILASHGGRPTQVTQIGLQILQKLSNSANYPNPPEIWFLTSESDPSGAGLWGLARTARLELPHLSIKCISGSEILKTGVEIKAWCTAIAISKPSMNETEFRICNDKLQASRLKRAALLKNDTTNSKTVVRPNVTYMISGGLGALGLEVAKWLVGQGATHVALLSRRSSSILPAELLPLQAPASIVCLQCDVSNLDQVDKIRKSLDAMHWPEVCGVFHAAGVLADSTISNMDASSLAVSFGPKADGVRNLREIFKPSDYFVIFSSAAAVFGSAGQANYAAANATMDALAENWSNNGENVLSIQWGAWSGEGAGSGMAGDEATIRRAERHGLTPISNSFGLEALQKLLQSAKFGTVCVAPIDWTKMAILTTPFVDNFRTTTKVEVLPEFPKSRNEEDVRAIVRKVAVDVLGVATVGDDAPLLDSGMDSLGSVEFRNLLSSEFDLSLPPGILFSFPTIQTLSNHLVQITTKKTGQVMEVLPLGVPLSTYPTLVIGAGMAGLSFAKVLAQAGQSVIVMDAKEAVGGVWDSWANSTSKLQIDAPSYDFGSIDSKEKKTWPTTYPNRETILRGAQEAAESLGAGAGSLLLKTRVDRVTKINQNSDNSDSGYIVDYTRDGAKLQMKVGGVVALTGGLHVPCNEIFPGELTAFQGKCALGIQDDVELSEWKNAQVVIVGHGAFAIENMRTALENGAERVTIVCRKRNLVFSTFCNWVLNSSEGGVPVQQVLDIMRPFYKMAAGVNVDDLPCFSKVNGENYFDQSTVPPASDLYFLAQALDRLEVLEDEIDRMTGDSVVTRKGRVLKAGIVLKCFGFHTKDDVIPSIFGAEAKDTVTTTVTVDGLWINRDPNLFTYNDGGQVNRKVKSFLCSSYLFFVHAFAKAYLHYRQNPTEFQTTIQRIQGTRVEESAGRVMVELWDFLASSKKQLSERTRLLCPFEKFQRDREREWDIYKNLLKPETGAGSDLKMWNFLAPVFQEVHRRDPTRLVEERPQFSHLLSSVFRPQRKARVLFLHGQGTNANIANNLLERTGWIGQFSDTLEFVIPDAPHELPAFTNQQQLEEIGLDSLVEQNIYDQGAIYREWGADFDWFAQIANGRTEPLTDSDLRTRGQSWTLTLDYLQQIVQTYGPFDGVVGFCEGATVLSVALHMQAAHDRSGEGRNFGLRNARFFIAMAPWRSPFFERQGMFKNETPLAIPSLHITGRADMELFKQGAVAFRKDFEDPKLFEHGGKHVYPVLAPSLKTAVKDLLNSVGF